MIKIQNLTKKYGRKNILSNINVTFYPGHIYGLWGPNGCGKTTLMRCICGFSQCNTGTIEVNGNHIGYDRDFPDKTGIILETPSFLQEYSGYMNLLLLARTSRKVTPTAVQNAMLAVGLNPKESKPVAKYSLGMRQRLGIAQAIMEDPSVLILDEPFNALDRQAIKVIHNLLQKGKAQGKTILLASHSIIDLTQACDTIYEIRDGTLHEYYPQYDELIRQI